MSLSGYNPSHLHKYLYLTCVIKICIMYVYVWNTYTYILHMYVYVLFNSVCRLYMHLHTCIFFPLRVGNPGMNQLASQLSTTYICVIFFLPVNPFMHYMKITTGSGFQAASWVKMGKSQWPASLASMWNCGIGGKKRKQKSCVEIFGKWREWPLLGEAACLPLPRGGWVTSSSTQSP